MDGDNDGAMDDTLVRAGHPVDTKLTEQPASTIPPTEDANRSLPVRYRLGAVLGRGGMGEVLTARDEQLGRPVAIKRLRAQTSSPAGVTRFLREARIQGRLEHPSIVPVHELGEDVGGQPFFAMRQLTGVTLADVLAELAVNDPGTTREFTQQRLLRAFADVCLAIEFAHTRGVVHRDLKPANIVIGDFGEVYILDWGVAHIADAVSEARFPDVDTLESGGTEAGAILGTRGYMSPEQVAGEVDIDGRSDVYALGAILFEILAHTPLHERDEGLMAPFLGVDARPSIRAPARDTPPELDTICVKATALDRNDRYATARQLGDAVQRFLDGDRDLVLRKQLARTELTTARAALEEGNAAEHRRVAVRAAARALALDPTNPEPAELVGRLMLEPPAEVPRDVEIAIETLDLNAMYAGRRLMMAGAIAYATYFPVLFWIGFRDPWFIVSGGVLFALIVAAGWLVPKRWEVPLGYFALASNALVIALFAWALTPFFIAPTLGVVTAMALATHPRIARPWVLVSVIVTAILSPFVLELFGVTGRSTFVVGSLIILETAGTREQGAPEAYGALVIYVVAVVTIAVVVARTMTNERRAAQKKAEIQSWQLRQLVV
jgi:serine/threonine protein kinase